MLWFKRNLFLAITGLVALILLGGGIWFVMGGRTRNAELDQEVEQTRGQLNNIYGKDPFPHTTNIDTARKEITKLRGEVQKLTKYFTPVPVERADAREFLAMRDRTLSDLRDAAQKAKVELPGGTPPYAFSFDVQRGKVGSFGMGTFPTVPEQMAEVKALCSALYDARVTRLINVRRSRASTDDLDARAPQQDYTAGVENMTNAQSITHPFEISFTCFSAEIARVLTSLAKSPHGFVVKAVQVEPEIAEATPPGVGVEGGGPQVTPTGQPAFPRQPRQFPPRGNNPRPLPAPPPVAAPAPPRPVAPAANDRPIVLLKEHRLRVTMLVYAIKPAK